MSWADEPLLDPEQLGGYADLLPPEQMATLIETYRRELATRPAEIIELIERGDIASVRIAAHRLKGASLTIGARRVAMLSGEIEETGGDALADLAQALQDCAAATNEAFGTALDGRD